MPFLTVNIVIAKIFFHLTVPQYGTRNPNAGSDVESNDGVVHNHSYMGEDNPNRQDEEMSNLPSSKTVNNRRVSTYSDTF